MKRLVVSAAACDDLGTVARYSECEWGKARKKQYVAAIRARFDLLRQQPEIGAERPDLATGYRSLPVGRHMIFYRIEMDSVVVIRVLHQRMDVGRHLKP